MNRTIEAIYERGVLRPLEPLLLGEQQRVWLTISDSSVASRLDLDAIERARDEVAALRFRPSIEEVRAALAAIPGSLADDVIAERGDYWLPRYFFDTSALVMQFHREPGTITVSAIFAELGREIRISTLGLLEMNSALAIKVRTGVIDRRAAETLRAALMLDIASGAIELNAVLPNHFATAQQLVAKLSFLSQLRALDALQWAVALDLASQALVDYFVCADQTLAAVAETEGMSVIVPLKP